MLCSLLHAQYPEWYQVHSKYSGNVLNDYFHPFLQHHVHRCTHTHSPEGVALPVQAAFPGAGLYHLLVACAAQSPGSSSRSRQEGLVSWAPAGRVAAPLLFPEPRLTGGGLGVS